MFAKNEINEVNEAIRHLLIEGEALARVRKITAFLAQNKADMPPSAQDRLHKQAEHLLDVVGGKVKDSSIGKIGEKPDACQMLRSFAQNEGNEKPSSGEHGSKAGDSSQPHAEAGSAK
ncbi:hypothetical protein WDW86_21315 [Bdellovibrionota bacterium FG-2]